MSHFTKVKTKIKNLNRLKEVLTQLNYQFTEATEGQPLKIKGWQKREHEVQLAIKTGSQYEVGVVLNEAGECELVADWWGVETYTGVSEQEFLNKIVRKYAYNTVMEKVKTKGYDIVEEQVGERQQVRIVVRKWT